MLYGAGQRPAAADLSRIAAGSSEFAIVFAGAPREGFAEALVTGLSFDIVGLAPADAARHPEIAYRVGIEAVAPLDRLEAVAIRPGPHLAGGANMLPVVRACLALAKALAGESGAQAVAWLPAGTAIKPTLFAAMTEEWLSGGAFPALGLTALVADGDRGLASKGLAFFIGQEIEIAPANGAGAADNAKLAARLMHDLVNIGPLGERITLTAANGEPLLAEPSADGRTVLVRPAT